MKIYIDAGHGGSSIGATHKGRKEQDDCLRLALKVKELLLTQKDIEVKLSREKDVNPDIDDRCAEANKWGADYFCSIHRNAFKPNSATGAEVWLYSKVKKNGDTYTKAEKILELICAATGYKNRGVKLGAPSYTDFGVNRLTKMHSALFEIGFIDSDSDNVVFDEKFNDMAKAIAKGLYEVNGGKWVEVVEEKKETEENGQIYYIQAGAYKDRKAAEEEAERISKLIGIKCFVGVKGDLDGDGKVTSADARLAMRSAVGLE